MNIFTKVKAFVLKYKLWVILAVIAAVATFAFAGNGEAEETYTITADSLVSDGVTVSGKVVAHEDVELGFESTGRVSSVAVKEGQEVARGAVIARLDAAEIAANLLKAQSDLDAERAVLAELQDGENNLTEVSTARESVVRVLKSAFTTADDAVRNKTDQFIRDADTRKPDIVFIFDDYDLKLEIDEERVQIGALLAEWRVFNDALTAASFTPDKLAEVKENLADVKEYIELVSRAVNTFEANGTYPQSTIDKYKTDVAAARSAIDSAQADVVDAEESLRGTVSQIPYQEAKVKSAQATVQSYQAQLSKAAIVAPFSGVVTRQDAKVGMIASANDPVVTLMSASQFELETFVPEVYLANIKVGNRASVTLDAYSDGSTFPASVTLIDTAATDRDGVATYKVRLEFDADDDRIRSGMTASVTIAVDAPTKAIRVPARALINRNGDLYVKVKEGDTVELRSVAVGAQDLETVEITAGLAIGDVVLLQPEI
jgi:HlyD family secretion protein